MITEEEYKQYSKEIDEFIEKYLNKRKDGTFVKYNKTDECIKNLSVKNLKIHEYSLINKVNKYYYYAMFPEEFGQKQISIEKLENRYNEELKTLDDLKYALKVFYASPYIRKQIVDDDVTPEDIEEEIKRIEIRLKFLEKFIDDDRCDYETQKVKNVFTNKYYKCKRDLEKVQKELSKLENTEK